MGTMSDEGTRLNKYIASTGLCSRRAADELIAHRRVTINGELIEDMGRKVMPGDDVRVDNNRLSPKRTEMVVMLKPRGVVTTKVDPRRRRTVMDLMPESHRHLNPVGRLDYDTEGLLLFTNDGELAARLTHARFGVEKEYEAWVVGVPDEKDIRRLQRGVKMPDGTPTGPCTVKVVRTNEGGAQSLLRIVLKEGRNHQVKNMGDAIGHPVVKLRRVRFGFITDKGMRPNEVRKVGQKEMDRLRQMVGLLDE
jgi:23S rRNA pseudouridine2605 synthase